jgi:acetylornithine aminotransferase
VYAPKLILARGQGVWVWDVEGREYLDLLSGIAVSLLGHGHPVYVERVQQQVANLVHVSNVFFTEPQIRLAERLTELTFAKRVFFANSGAEANEAAIKLARRHQRMARKADRFEIVAMKDVPWPHDGRIERDRAAQIPRGFRALGARLPSRRLQ